MSETEEQQARAVARRVFAALSTKWALRVLEEIGDGERRFGELHRETSCCGWCTVCARGRAPISPS
ncbi:hypothetical protein ACIHAX_08275 [Nocardia sp. NPDC051929]|uniref:hypothetical protein n=1 Tax=Nocardia sp. NPDC051929 TaxID=3364327 RepID=UPI0037CBDE6F